MKSQAQFTEDGLKICSTCRLTESKMVVFRKKRNQCLSCINKIRNAGFKRKIRIENALLKDYELNALNQYKKEWYEDNKEKISEENKVKYLNSRLSRIENAKSNYYDPQKITSNLVKNTKARAKAKKLLFDLDKGFIEQLLVEQNNKCCITKLEFLFEKVNFSKRPFSPSIDRINSNLGYTKDNVRIVCCIVNFALNEFGDDAFHKMCSAYINNA